MHGTLVRRLAAPVSHLPATTIVKQSNSPQAIRRPRTRTLQSAEPLSLERFLLRSRVLKLYRTILRAIYQIPNKDARKDPVSHAKGEFARNRNIQESEQIRYLVSTGKAEWDGMRRYVEEMAVRARA